MSVKTITVAAVLGLCGATGALADGHDRHEAVQLVYGRVVDVQPMVRHVAVNRPRQECWDEVVREPVRPFGTVGPTIAGGVVGAAIGRQFGSGNDRDVLTLIGAAAGSAVAHQVALRNQGYATREVTVQRCEVVNDRVIEERIDGYLVTYQYQGRRYTMRTDTPPRDRVQLAVDVRPVGYRVRY
jgi:uncharacterized protein YcfJ